MKKIIKVFLSLVLICSCFTLAACSDDQKSSKTYTVTLKSAEVSPYDIDGVINGGDFLDYDGIWDIIEVEEGSVIGEIVINTNLAEQLGYKFCGWYSDQSYTLSWNLMLYPVNGDITLYAKWEKIN